MGDSSSSLCSEEDEDTRERVEAFSSTSSTSISSTKIIIATWLISDATCCLSTPSCSSSKGSWSNRSEARFYLNRSNSEPALVPLAKCSRCNARTGYQPGRTENDLLVRIHKKPVLQLDENEERERERNESSSSKKLHLLPIKNRYLITVTVPHYVGEEIQELTLSDINRFTISRSRFADSSRSFVSSLDITQSLGESHSFYVTLRREYKVSECHLAWSYLTGVDLHLRETDSSPATTTIVHPFTFSLSDGSEVEVCRARFALSSPSFAFKCRSSPHLTRAKVTEWEPNLFRTFILFVTHGKEVYQFMGGNKTPSTTADTNNRNDKNNKSGKTGNKGSGSDGVGVVRWLRECADELIYLSHEYQVRWLVEACAVTLVDNLTACSALPTLTRIKTCYQRGDMEDVLIIRILTFIKKNPKVMDDKKGWDALATRFPELLAQVVSSFT